MGDYKVDMQQYLNQTNRTVEQIAEMDPALLQAFGKLSQQAKKPGALSTRTKELICVALSVAAHCAFCIASHVNHAIEA